MVSQWKQYLAQWHGSALRRRSSAQPLEQQLSDAPGHPAQERLFHRARQATRARLALPLIAAVVLLAACAGGPALTALPGTPQVLAPAQDTMAYNPPRVAPALALTDQQAKPFDLTSLRGSVALIYFGYTHCPDVCPATLADLRTAVGDSGMPARVVFVTVDPQRDTPDVLSSYLEAYKAGFIGLTGTDAQVAAAAAAWAVGYGPEPPESRGTYSVTHTAETFLVDGSGLLRDHIPVGTSPAEIARLIKTAASG